MSAVTSHRNCFLRVGNPSYETLYILIFPLNLLIASDSDTLSQTLNLELLTSGTAVDILDIIGGSLKVACSVVALGDEHVVLGAVLNGLIDGDGRTLKVT